MNEKKKPYQRITEQISGLFVPIINYLTAASLIKCIVILLAQFHVISEASGVYKIFFAVSDGFFYFLPFFLAITASRQWKTDLYLSLFIPVAMLYPDILAILEHEQTISFLGIKIQPAIYHSSVIPVLLAVGLLYFVEKPCDRYIPEAIRGFLKPMICALLVLPATFLLFGPIGSWIGNFLTHIFNLLYDWNSLVAGGFMGFLIQPMVAIGAQWSVVPVSMGNISTQGYDILLPLLGGAVYGQCGACLAMSLIYDKRLKEQRRIALQAALSAGLGVTEPSLYGVTLRSPRAMLSACLAGAVGGAIAGAAGVHCTSFAFPSFLTCIAYISPGFLFFLISMAVALPIGFALTMLQRKALKKQCAELFPETAE